MVFASSDVGLTANNMEIMYAGVACTSINADDDTTITCNVP